MKLFDINRSALLGRDVLRHGLRNGMLGVGHSSVLRGEVVTGHVHCTDPSPGSSSLQTVGRLWSKPPGWDPLAIAKPTWRRRWPPAPARERGDLVVI